MFYKFISAYEICFYSGKAIRSWFEVVATWPSSNRRKDLYLNVRKEVEQWGINTLCISTKVIRKIISNAADLGLKLLWI